MANFKLQGREYPTYMLADEIYYYYKELHNPMAGAVYNRLSPFNQQDYFNAAKDLNFVINDSFTPGNPRSPGSPKGFGRLRLSA